MNILIILGKFPKKGKVKSRLAKEIGEEKATEFYKNCLEHILREVDKLKSLEKFFYFSEPQDEKSLRKWIGDKYKLVSPQTNNIEEKLNLAFEEHFKRGAKKVICIATDVPDLNARILQEALDMLDSFDIVIGSDQTGGIYLFGSKKSYPELFKKGEGGVLDRTLKKIKKLNLSYYKLPTLLDIDTLEDLQKYLSLRFKE